MNAKSNIMLNIMIFSYNAIILSFKNRDNDILMNLREILQIIKLIILCFLQCQCENSWTLVSNLYKMIDFITK